MNTHPSPSTSSSAPAPVGLNSALHLVEQAGPRLARLGLVWAAAAALAFAVAGSVDSSFQAPFEFAKWVSAILSVQFFGRWVQNQRMRHWLAYQLEAANGSPVWNEIPSPSARLTTRSFASFADLQAPDWKVGETQARAHDQDIPAWVAHKGDRFEFAGQTAGLARGLNENERLVGNLLYVKPVKPLIEPVPTPLPDGPKEA